MLEKLMNFILWASELSTRSSDPWLNECRGYQKRILWPLALSVFLMLLSMLVISMGSGSTPFGAVVAPVVAMLGLGLTVAAFVALLVVVWNGIALYRFEKAHGIRGQG
jgi:hypothetical protein